MTSKPIAHLAVGTPQGRAGVLSREAQAYFFRGKGPEAIKPK